MSADRSWVDHWGGLGALLLGVVLMLVQFLGLKYLWTPWYVPGLASLGAILLLVAVVQRWTLIRGGTLLVVAVLAGLLWFFFGVLTKLPDYDGPAQAGSRLPAFRAVLADGRPFTDADLRDGSRRAMTFFRGRW